MFDQVRWDAALPEGHPADDRVFQTKSLERCMDNFVVTPEGRLVLTAERRRIEDADASTGVDVDFHVDLRLVSNGAQDYLARFTNGTLEWIRPLAVDAAYCSVAEARNKLPKDG